MFSPCAPPNLRKSFPTTDRCESLLIFDFQPKPPIIIIMHHHASSCIMHHHACIIILHAPSSLSSHRLRRWPDYNAPVSSVQRPAALKPRLPTPPRSPFIILKAKWGVTSRLQFLRYLRVPPTSRLASRLSPASRPAPRFAALARPASRPACVPPPVFTALVCPACHQSPPPEKGLTCTPPHEGHQTPSKSSICSNAND